ncbi:hypothetical protein [Paenibacillus sp. YIM B09110]
MNRLILTGGNPVIITKTNKKGRTPETPLMNRGISGVYCLVVVV